MDRWRLVLTVAVVLLAFSLFVLDIMTPLRLAVWLPYIVVVMMSLWLPDRRFTYFSAALVSALTIAGTMLSPPAGEMGIAVINRLLAVVVFWIVAVLGLAARRTHQLAQANAALHQEMERRQRLETQLLRTQRLESIGILAGGIAHDFNNLLTPILMAVKLLKENRPEDDRLRLINTLQLSAERGAEMVRQLLSFAGDSEGPRVVVEPKTIINEVAAILDHIFPKSIQIQMRLSDDVWPVFANATQLSQVLMNLCVNARDAMPDGGVMTIEALNAVLSQDDPRLQIEAKSGDYIVIVVRDTGVGIAKELIDRVFDPFFSTKGPGKGSGLGLSTALGIVQGHGGFINVSSEPAKGAEFQVYLPATAPRVIASSDRLQPKLPEGGGKLILMVDDEPLILETAKATLERRGYRVLTAPEGQSAIDLCRKHSRDILAVILDMMLPGMDGPSVLSELHSLRPDLPIIVSSGLPVSGRVAESISIGRGAFLPKPYSDEQMLLTIANVIKKNTQ